MINLCFSLLSLYGNRLNLVMNNNKVKKRFIRIVQQGSMEG